MIQHPFGVRCADAAARILRGDVYKWTVGKSEAVCQGRPRGAFLAPDCLAAYANPFPENEVWSYLENAIREKVR